MERVVLVNMVFGTARMARVVSNKGKGEILFQTAKEKREKKEMVAARLARGWQLAKKMPKIHISYCFTLCFHELNSKGIYLSLKASDVMPMMYLLLETTVAEVVCS
nr:hypothetical protein Iba_chr13fCG11840 [Ipomoea batatas]